MTSPAGTSALKASDGGAHEAGVGEGLLGLGGGRAREVGHGHLLDALADEVGDGGPDGHAGCRARGPG